MHDALRRCQGEPDQAHQRDEVAPLRGCRVGAVTGAAGVDVTLLDRHQHPVARGTTDRFGALVFRELDQGGRYFVQDGDSNDVIPATVLEFEDNPDDAFYRQQTLHDGFQYIRGRDGTL